jgi:hypothetical protein
LFQCDFSVPEKSGYICEELNQGTEIAILHSWKDAVDEQSLLSESRFTGRN